MRKNNRKGSEKVKVEDEVLRVLPLKIASEIRKVIANSSIQEIRIRVDKPIILYTTKGELVIDIKPTMEEAKQILVKISNYSLYAFEEEIRQGYITLKGGHRVGLAGECVVVSGTIRTIKNISSINIRVCREIKGCSDKYMEYLVEKDRVLNTLIVSPPKCGKTTILRDIARNLSNGTMVSRVSGKKITIIDERSEIGACFNGVPQMDIGIRTDILDNCLKKDGMLMAIRSLSPEVLICDEIGTEGDVEALHQAFNSGVNIVVTIHGYSIEDILRRSTINNMLTLGILDRIIVLSNRNGVGTLENIYSVEMDGALKCLK